MKIKINVLEEDIKKGKKGIPTNCPIACAARRKFPGNKINVDYRHMSIGNVAFKLPLEAKRFMRKFDDSRVVKPFNFFTVDTENDINSKEVLEEERKKAEVYRKIHKEEL